MSGTSPTLSQIKNGVKQILEESPSLKQPIMSPGMMSDSGYSCTSSVVDWKYQVRIERQIRKQLKLDKEAKSVASSQQSGIYHQNVDSSRRHYQ